MTQYYIVSEEELYWIKNDCGHPLSPGCDGCEYARPEEANPCIFKGANALIDEVLTRPYNRDSLYDTDEVIQLENIAVAVGRNDVLDKLAKWVREYDTMYYGDDMPVDIIRDKLEELRVKKETHTKDISNVKKMGVDFTCVRHVDGD